MDGVTTLYLALAVLAGQTFTADMQRNCPEAVRETEQLRAASEPPRVPKASTRPALRENLLLMAKQDQEARALVRFSEGPLDAASARELKRMQDVDAANLRRLRHIIDQDGFPTAEMVGLDGVDAAWLLAIHAAGDPDFQQRVLELTTGHVRRGEVRPDQVALLTDDLLAGRGKLQRYGTNFELREGELVPAPIEDEANVDRRRRSVGLISLANYTCIIRAAYGSSAPQSVTSPSR
jgi:hypothetical protein